MLKKLSFLATILLVSACATNSSLTEKNAPDTEAKIASEDADDRQIICKRTQTVGTNFKKKQCWTKEDYDDLQKRSREAVERAQGSGMSGPEGR